MYSIYWQQCNCQFQKQHTVFWLDCDWLVASLATLQNFWKIGHSSIFQLQLEVAETRKAKLSARQVIVEFQMEVNDCFFGLWSTPCLSCSVSPRWIYTYK